MDAKQVALKLQAPFDDKDIEWRAQMSGEKDGSHWALLLAYVDNRAIQDRLDDVVGVDRWRNEFAKAPDGGVMCGISVKFDEWITKYDGAENTNMEAVKGGLSSSMKRAAVQWGIGRYLYNLSATIVTLSTTKSGDDDLLITVKLKEGDREVKKRMYCRRPRLPEWALPSLETIEKLQEKIRNLGKELNHPDSITETRVKRATTVHDAQIIIDDLESRRAKAEG